MAMVPAASCLAPRPFGISDVRVNGVRTWPIGCGVNLHRAYRGAFTFAGPGAEQAPPLLRLSTAETADRRNTFKSRLLGVLSVLCGDRHATVRRASKSISRASSRLLA